MFPIYTEKTTVISRFEVVPKKTQPEISKSRIPTRKSIAIIPQTQIQKPISFSTQEDYDVDLI